MKTWNVVAALGMAVGASFAVQAAETEQTQQETVLQNLKWVMGPTSVPIGTNAMFAVPADYVFLNAADTKSLMEMMHNTSSGDEYYFGPRDESWFAIFEYEETGHVKDDETIDAAALLESMREGNELANKERVKRGWETMRIVGWKHAPFYDPSTKRLAWAIEGESNGHSIINYNTRILGRTGVTSATLVASPEILDQAVIEFKTVVKGYDFNPGQRYAEFQEGDHMAEFGLAALVAGGAAAVATKKGFWAAMAGFFAAAWKFLAAGAIALGAWLKSMFSKKS